MGVPGRPTSWASVLALGVLIAGTALGASAYPHHPPAAASVSPDRAHRPGDAPAGALSGGAPSGSSSSTDVVGCPTTPPAPPSPPAGANQLSVAAGAHSVLACEYEALNRPLGLARGLLVTDPETIARLGAEADPRLVLPPGLWAQVCPADLGTIADAYFEYWQGTVMLLEVHLGGCSAEVDRYGSAEAPQLDEDLRQLLAQ